jgi:hypothetical protein
VSGFYGDRLAAAREMLDGPDPIDVLTGDYLAELTMLILWKARRKDPSTGYATTFLRQMEDVLGTCVERGVKIVTNAGGLNPHGLAERLRELSATLGVSPAIAVVEGDDLVPRLADLQASGIDLAHLDTGQVLADAGVEPVTANAYLGGWGIAAALDAGADIVVCPRVTDAALVVGPAASWHSWSPTDWDRLAGAVAAGHVIECGPQATGGNYAFAAEELPDLRYPGFPIAEIAEDGSSVITKQPGSGGAVTVGTVTAQLLYEIAEPAYANPDVVTRFDTLRLDQEGPDRVRISGTRGAPPSGQVKVALNYPGGWRNTMTLMLTGLDIEDKAARALAQLEEVVGGWEQFASHDAQLIRTDHSDAERNDLATAQLRITVKDPDPDRVGRSFSNRVMELLLASYAGAFTTTPPTSPSEYGVYWPALVPASVVDHAVVLPDGTRRVIAHPPTTAGAAVVDGSPPPAWTSDGPTRRVPLGHVAGARSGDKGGNANVGLWARTDDAHRWLASYLTVERLRELLPEADNLEIRRFDLPNLRALNFVVVGLLGEGVASSVRSDPQAKGLGEYVRSRLVDVPTELL